MRRSAGPEVTYIDVPSTRETGNARSRTTSVPAAAGGNVAYPAGEAAVYKVQEGTYYGNIFDPANLSDWFSISTAIAFPAEVTASWNARPLLDRHELVMYERMSSCNSPGWTDSQASMFSRLCADADNAAQSGVRLCAANYAGMCGRQCAALKTPAGYGSYFDDCKDGSGTSWSHPLTIYLHSSCDITTCAN